LGLDAEILLHHRGMLRFFVLLGALCFLVIHL
jgi:hypothetical protein